MASEDTKKILEAVVKAGVTHEEVKDIYRQWALTYDQDLSQLQYFPPKYLSEAVANILRDRKDAKILDVACGTGLLAELLTALGYSQFDGVDASAEMVEIARSKNLYKRLICAYVGPNKLDIEECTYDVVASCGSFVPGHLDHMCFPELMRITKPGGYIVLIIAVAHLEKPEFKDKLEPAMQRHHDDGQWIWESSYPIENLFDGSPGKCYVFKVLNE